ncbi:MAG: M48 family metalloprotease, partial [Desulfosalsimonas sp.]
MTLKGKITALVLTLSMVLLPPAGSWAQMSVKDEKELAEEFLETVHRHFTVIEDPVIHNYINELGGRIVNALPPQPFEYKFHVIKQDSINAFAGPAGNIFVFSGLIEALDTESELAGILAHEIAHVSARH